MRVAWSGSRKDSVCKMAGGIRINWGPDPEWYVCSACGANHCKLWRTDDDGTNHTQWKLYCVVCAMHKVGWEGINVNSDGTNWVPSRGHSNLIGDLPDCLVPALLIKHSDEEERLSHAVMGMDGTHMMNRWQSFPSYPQMRPDPKTMWVRLVDGIGL
jgi:hypothetical protein